MKGEEERKGKGKGRFGEDVGCEGIVREAENDVVDEGLRIKKSCPEHACSIFR